MLHQMGPAMKLSFDAGFYMKLSRPRLLKTLVKWLLQSFLCVIVVCDLVESLRFSKSRLDSTKATISIPNQQSEVCRVYGSGRPTIRSPW